MANRKWDFLIVSYLAGWIPILARYLSGSLVSGFSQPSQQINTSCPATLIFLGAPIVPSGSPLTGQIFCFSASTRSSVERDAKFALILAGSAASEDSACGLAGADCCCGG